MSVLTNQTVECEKWGAFEKNSAVGISVVIPVTERCDDLTEIYRAHAVVLSRCGYSFEFIFVIDGGFEGPGKTLSSLVATGEPIQVVSLNRPFGEATALAIGFERAKGEVLVCLPSYFQIVPDGLEKVLDTLAQGYDLVITRRWPRIDSWSNRLQNRTFYLVLSWLTGVKFHDLGCSLRAMKKRVPRELPLYGDLHRFIPLLAYQKGFRIIEVDVPQHPADSKLRMYRPGIYLRRLLDIFTVVFLFKFTKKPLRFFGLIGAGLFGAGFFISLVLAVQKLLGLVSLADKPLLILGVLLMVLGVQTGSIGLLGEIIIFTHARKMKDYAVEKFLK